LELYQKGAGTANLPNAKAAIPIMPPSPTNEFIGCHRKRAYQFLKSKSVKMGKVE
jgi:hypothetical protein